MPQRTESWTQRTSPILNRLSRRPRAVRRFLPASAGLLTLLLVASGTAAQPSAPGSLSPLVREADDYYLGRWRIANVEKGLALLRQETLAHPRDYEAWWRIAEFDCYWVRARHDPANPKILLHAIAAAKRATALAPTRPEGHFWLGIAYGLYAERENLLLGLRLVGGIRRQMRLVEKLDPSYQQCGAQRTLARVDERLPLFAGGNKQRAIQLLQDCLKKYPHDSLTMLYLAEGLLAVGQAAAAQNELQAILRLCPNPNYGPEQLQNQAKARALLAKHFAQNPTTPPRKFADSSHAEGQGAAAPWLAEGSLGRNCGSGRNLHRRKTAHRLASREAARKAEGPPRGNCEQESGGRHPPARRIGASHHVEHVTAKDLKPIVKAVVKDGAHLMTDSSNVLASAGTGFRHDQVNHRAGEYVRRENGTLISPNGVESYFAILKRGHVGVYHHGSKKYLGQYLMEFDWRYNVRGLPDMEGAVVALKITDGKRLMLKPAASPSE